MLRWFTPRFPRAFLSATTHGTHKPHTETAFSIRLPSDGRAASGSGERTPPVRGVPSSRRSFSVDRPDGNPARPGVGADQGVGPLTLGIENGVIPKFTTQFAALHDLDISPEPVDPARTALMGLGLIGKGRRPGSPPKRRRVDPEPLTAFGIGVLSLNVTRVAGRSGDRRGGASIPKTVADSGEPSLARHPGASDTRNDWHAAREVRRHGRVGAGLTATAPRFQRRTRSADTPAARSLLAWSSSP